MSRFSEDAKNIAVYLAAIIILLQFIVQFILNFSNEGKYFIISCILTVLILAIGILTAIYIWTKKDTSIPIIVISIISALSFLALGIDKIWRKKKIFVKLIQFSFMLVVIIVFALCITWSKAEESAIQNETENYLLCKGKPKRHSCPAMENTCIDSSMFNSFFTGSNATLLHTSANGTIYCDDGFLLVNNYYRNRDFGFLRISNVDITGISTMVVNLPPWERYHNLERDELHNLQNDQILVTVFSSNNYAISEQGVGIEYVEVDLTKFREQNLQMVFIQFSVRSGYNISLNPSLITFTLNY